MRMRVVARTPVQRRTSCQHWWIQIVWPLVGASKACKPPAAGQQGGRAAPAAQWRHWGLRRQGCELDIHKGAGGGMAAEAQGAQAACGAGGARAGAQALCAEQAPVLAAAVRRTVVQLGASKCHVRRARCQGFVPDQGRPPFQQELVSWGAAAQGPAQAREGDALLGHQPEPCISQGRREERRRPLGDSKGHAQGTAGCGQPAAPPPLAFSTQALKPGARHQQRMSGCCLSGINTYASDMRNHLRAGP